MKWPTIVALLCAASALADEPPNPAARDRRAVVAAMSALRPQLDGCYARHHQAGFAVINLTIAPDGTVARAALRVGPWSDVTAGSPTAACVLGAVGGARFATLDGPPQTLDYPFVLGPR